jgi:hypothetical protein
MHNQDLGPPEPKLRKEQTHLLVWASPPLVQMCLEFVVYHIICGSVLELIVRIEGSKL